MATTTAAKIESPFLTMAEIATRLGLSRAHTYRLAHEGVFPCVRLGRRRLRIPRAAFETWLEEQNARALANVATPEKREPGLCRTQGSRGDDRGEEATTGPA